MRYLIVITQLFLSTIFTSNTDAQPFAGIRPKIIKIIKSGSIYRSAKVESDATHQSLHYEIYGIHPNSCRTALKKLSRYEQFHSYMDLVKLSGYDKKKKLIYLYLDHTLLPYPMVLNFKIDRITKIGQYQFSFDKGFLKGLLGKITVRDYNNKCIFSAISDWKGKKSDIPDSVFEVFSETIGELAMKKLFRVSRKL